MHRLFLTASLIISMSILAHGQFGAGFVFGIDFYQHYDQGERATDVESTTTGSIMANAILGPKFWIGGDRFSVSVEAPINWGIFALDIDDYKGLGSLAIPLGAKCNFGAASGFNQSNILGWSMGGGVQYTRTELYYTENRFEDRIETGFIPTYYGELGLSFGVTGVDINLYTRYGLNGEKSRNLNIGLVLNVNLVFIHKNNHENKFNTPPQPSYSSHF